MFTLRALRWMLVGLPLFGYGQMAPVSSPLTLPQALELARTNYPSLRARQASVATAVDNTRRDSLL